jgi:hypothetical protein
MLTKRRAVLGILVILVCFTSYYFYPKSTSIYFARIGVFDIMVYSQESVAKLYNTDVFVLIKSPIKKQIFYVRTYDDMLDSIEDVSVSLEGMIITIFSKKSLDILYTIDLLSIE